MLGQILRIFVWFGEFEVGDLEAALFGGATARAVPISTAIAWMRNVSKEKLFTLLPVPGKLNHADLGTKVLSSAEIRKHCKAINVSLDGGAGEALAHARQLHASTDLDHLKVDVAVAVERHLRSLKDLVNVALTPQR